MQRAGAGMQSCDVRKNIVGGNIYTHPMLVLMYISSDIAGKAIS